MFHHVNQSIRRACNQATEAMGWGNTAAGILTAVRYSDKLSNPHGDGPVVNGQLVGEAEDYLAAAHRDLLLAAAEIEKAQAQLRHAKTQRRNA